jgi:CO/xanthine dehydrogenase Mo-binding subunit
MSDFSIIGKKMPRHNAIEQSQGKLIYGNDLERPNMLYAKALFSEYSHAKILDVDISAAEKMPGVASVITAKDIPNNIFGISHIDQPILAEDKVRYKGDAIAVVAAESELIAQKAVDAIKVSYEELPAVYDPEEAMKAEAPLVHETGNVAARVKIKNGDIEKGFAEADLIVEEVFKTPKVIHGQIETHITMVEMDYDGKYIIWANGSRPFLYATHYARVMNLKMTDFQIKTPAVGGGFGSKNEIIAEPWLSVMAKKTGRPVKMVFTRTEEFQSTTVRHPYIMTYKTGVKKDGTITARSVNIVSDSGAYVGYGKATLTKASIHCMGPYVVPHMEVDSALVYTNTAVGGAMRGFGVPQVCFAYETHTDSIAKQLGMDPVEFRKKNMFGQSALMPTNQVVKSAPLEQTFDRAIKLSGGWKK